MIPAREFVPEVPDAVSRIMAGEDLRLVGVADAVQDAAKQEQEYRTWIDRRLHGSMKYLDRHCPMKYHPEKILARTASVLVVGINYYQKYHGPDQGAGTPGSARGRIARYAWGRDYHKVLGSRLRRAAARLGELYPGDSFRPFTDATPLAERFYAEAAGVGFTAKNTLTISSQFGSWFLLGELLSTRHFRPSGSAGNAHGACPRGCFRCINVCPTGALEAPYRIDARKCISYLTIEHKGSIPVELRSSIGDWLFGCDLCQEVCPLNVRAGVTEVADFRAHRAGSTRELRGILDIRTDEEFTATFAGSPLMRAGRVGLVRNACVVAANVGAVELLPRLRELSQDPDRVISEHAAWAVEVLGGSEDN